jgi:hypothetical protein
MDHTIEQCTIRNGVSLPADEAVTTRSAVSRRPEIKTRSWFSFIMALLEEAILVRIAPRIPDGRAGGESGLLSRRPRSGVLPPPLAEPQPRTR